jgi:hypothetical protein
MVIFCIYSDKKVDSLKKFYEDRVVELNSRWGEIEERFKDDPAFK